MPDNSPCAFPVPGPDGHPSFYGMTMREYFAGQALAGLSAHWGGASDPEGIADIAVRRADALIERLSR